MGEQVSFRCESPRWSDGIQSKPKPRTRATRCYGFPPQIDCCPPEVDRRSPEVDCHPSEIDRRPHEVDCHPSEVDHRSLKDGSWFHPTPQEASIEQWGREITGRTLDGRYRIGPMLGYGATGGVFAGVHLRLNRAVAIKILHEELRFNPLIRSRFDREAHAASRLTHPNCVEIIDVGEDAELNYLVMPFVDGVELREVIGTPMKQAMAVSLIQQVLAALEHAHDVGIVHRDVKPENVLIARDHRGQLLVKLLDFGLAKVALPPNHKRLTRAGQVFGTPQYMSPEQARGAEVTVRSDLYSTGLLFYELLTGQPVYDADDPLELVRQHLTAPPPVLTGVVPEAVAPMLHRMLAKDPLHRYGSATEARAALAHAVLEPMRRTEQSPTTAKRHRTTELAPRLPSRTITLPANSPARSTTLLAATSTSDGSTTTAPSSPNHRAVRRPPHARPASGSPSWATALLVATVSAYLVLGIWTATWAG